MCITGYSVMDNSIKQSVIQYFHNVDYGGIPIIPPNKFRLFFFRQTVKYFLIMDFFQFHFLISFLRENGYIERAGSKKQDIGMCYKESR